jgi:glycosyltransferase involved in cell wall biosynthesis
LKVVKGTVCVILPALNEELTVGKVIDEIPRQALEREGYRVDILVVDGNSSDQTRQIARQKGARVVVEPRRGKGRAVRSIIDLIEAEYVFMLDADYTYPATYIPQMLDVLRHGSPVVIGSRLRGKREKGAMRWFNIVGNMMLTRVANLLYRTRISDLCTGYWGMRAEVIPELTLLADGFQLEAELFAELSKKGYPIAEVPTDYRCREGKAKLSGLKDGIKILWMLIKRRFEPRGLCEIMSGCRQ